MVLQSEQKYFLYLPFELFDVLSSSVLIYHRWLLRTPKRRDSVEKWTYDATCPNEENEQLLRASRMEFHDLMQYFGG